ncbi:MAG TPA: UbiX family flavin prenyltransferase [Thermodesulfobacteriota bacterium]|nr:UbiX family flavin prenyltransferase [Thermodesulfobacteriota bacterium]
MRIVVGISGASGAIYGIRLLEVLRELKVETHLVLTSAGEDIIRQETSWSPESVRDLATFSYSNQDLAAPVSSGSFLTDGMVVIPCSIKSLSAIANSYAENLLSRAAEVSLKEQRKLVLVVRETPFHKGTLRLMLQAAEQGAAILPPIPAFYFRPRTVDDIVNHTVGKVLDFFRLPHNLFARWGTSQK